jgi:peptidoglycan hydrolase CwlO-like protein
MNIRVDELDKFLRDTYVTKSTHALKIDKMKTEINKSNVNIDALREDIEI